MQSLENRVAALEASTLSEGGITEIWRVIVSPGNLSPNITRVCDDAGAEWLSHPGESAQELQERAASAARRNENGIAWLTGEDANDDNT